MIHDIVDFAKNILDYSCCDNNFRKYVLFVITMRRRLNLHYSIRVPATQRVAALARTRAARRLGTTRWVLELATAENLCVVFLGGE